jgi:hypothetical protein
VRLDRGAQPAGHRPGSAAAGGHPKPPSQAEINAAENQVRQHQAALGTEQGKLSGASAALTKLQTQAEVLIERYDQAQVNAQRAASAQAVTEARLRRAERQQAASRLRVARMAAQQFESGGGFSPVTAMLGDADGPQAYLRQVGMGQALAESGTDILAANQANDAVARVFRTQAHKLLVAKQADLQEANDLKVAIQAAVSRQQTFVKLARGKRNKLAGELAAAQSKASSLKAARQARAGPRRPPNGPPGRPAGRLARARYPAGRGARVPRPARAMSQPTGR